MKILFTIPWFFPAYKAGGPVTSMVNLIKSIGKEADMKVLTGDRDLKDITPFKGVDMDKWNVFGDSEVFYISSKTTLIQRILLLKNNSIDVLFINGIYSFNYTILPVLFINYKRVIISARGMLLEHALKQKKNKKSVYLYFFKLLVKKFNIEFHATDEEERRQIRKIIGERVKIWVAPNFPNRIKSSTIEKKRNKINLLTVALIGPMKNHKLVLESLRHVDGEVNYDIIGPVYFEDYWNDCLAIISTLPPNVKIKYHGSVIPDDLEKFYKNAHVFICPSNSENFGHSFFESLSSGRPVISSNNTPWQNLSDSKSGLNVEIKVEEIVSAIQFFIDMCNSTYQEWSSSTLEYAHSRFDFEKTKSDYLTMFGI